MHAQHSSPTSQLLSQSRKCIIFESQLSSFTSTNFLQSIIKLFNLFRIVQYILLTFKIFQQLLTLSILTRKSSGRILEALIKRVFPCRSTNTSLMKDTGCLIREGSFVLEICPGDVYLIYFKLSDARVTLSRLESFE